MPESTPNTLSGSTPRLPTPYDLSKVFESQSFKDGVMEIVHQNEAKEHLAGERALQNKKRAQAWGQENSRSPEEVDQYRKRLDSGNLE